MEQNKQESTPLDGIIMEALPGTTFRVRLSDGSEIIGYLAGKMRKHYIKVVPGDSVTVELSGYADGKGRITRRK
ncbi:MAG: Translation initiation factor IF-1 [Parcubacteria group bacterium GW2011_GWC1_41_7]|nr:MAG: Translation initiation factor IF-1 [Parcubacteria group bacterium GW2011_GWC1_41_7]